MRSTVQLRRRRIPEFREDRQDRIPSEIFTVIPVNRQHRQGNGLTELSRVDRAESKWKLGAELTDKGGYDLKVEIIG